VYIGEPPGAQLETKIFDEALLSQRAMVPLAWSERTLTRDGL
jgi:hypothetical protein